MKYKPGHKFAKKAGAGFVGEPLPFCMIADDQGDEHEPCFLCEDPECVEWPNCYVLNEAGEKLGLICHVSECQMLPVGFALPV